MMETETRQIHNFHEGDKFHEHYRLLEHVGTGGFADVWKAKDELVDTIVALKIYTRLDLEGISELAKEYKEMKGVKHPNLLTGNHFDASGNIPYLEMDYCDGGSLFGKIGKMSNQELLRMVGDVANGLAYLHKEGIVHQDIKPENILYDTEHGRYLLSDFGISSKSRTRLSKSVNKANMSLSMTEAYAPPEKFSGNMDDLVPDVKGDIFSLGMTIFELAVGQLPFDPPMATGREMFYSQGRLQLDYSKVQDPQLRKIVEACINYRKDKRPTAEEITKMLDRGSQTDQETGKPSGGERPPTVKVNIHSDDKPKQEVKQPTTKVNSTNARTTKDDGAGKHKPAFKTRNWLLAIVGVLVAVVATIALWPNTVDDSIVIEEKTSDVRLDGNTLRFTVDGQEYSYNMVYVEGGTFTMGCTSEQGGECYSDEKPSHGVTLSSYYIGETEVTQALWKAVMGSKPSCWKGDNLPVEQVSYYDVETFIIRLSQKTGRTFRMPTEAEWEYAARGGKKSRGYKYSGSNSVGDVAWYDGNSGDKTHPVRQKQPNELGIYDMSGNVWEWCSDWHDSYSSGSQTNPMGPSSGSERVFRGGSTGPADCCRVLFRNFINPSGRFYFVGFRLVLVP